MVADRDRTVTVKAVHRRRIGQRCSTRAVFYNTMTTDSDGDDDDAVMLIEKLFSNSITGRRVRVDRLSLGDRSARARAVSGNLPGTGTRIEARRRRIANALFLFFAIARLTSICE